MDIGNWMRFAREYLAFRRQAKSEGTPFRFGKLYPCLKDREKDIEARGHYFHQDLLVARKIFLNNPAKHVDVGSRLDGLVAHVASFRKIEVIDIRPLEVTIPNVVFRQADIMSPDFGLKQYCDSLSSLHAVEHFGLGRYGDALDVNGFLKGLQNLHEMLQSGGKLYFSVPIGDQRIEFNAHRIFSLRHIFELFEGGYHLDAFSYIDDDGALIKQPHLEDSDIDNNCLCYYGCGIFEFTKLADNVSCFWTKQNGAWDFDRGYTTIPVQAAQGLKRVIQEGEAVDACVRDDSSGEKEHQLLDELIRVFRKFGVEDTKKSYGAEKQWKELLNRLRNSVLNDNPRKFLQWDVIRETMFVANEPYVDKELGYLQQSPDWDSCWREAIEEIGVGCPVPYSKYPKSSGNLIHHAYHLCQFQNTAGANIADIRLVFEFGGGYGSMCRLFYNLGFQGIYVMFDLPHLIALQRYYLRMSGIPVLNPEALQAGGYGVVCIADLGELEQVLLTCATENHANAMAIGTWSISEAPLHVRDKILSLVREFDLFLYAFQDQYAGIDNQKYFRSLRRQFPDVEWEQHRIEHLPGNNYFFGRRMG